MAASTTIDIIGWDEAKSRPIYRHIPKSSSSTAAPVVKNRVKINKSSSTTSNDIDIISEELSPFNYSRVVTTTKQGVSKTKRANNKKARTISLSPQGEKKIIRWGDNTIREEEADVDISFASTSSITTTTNNIVNKKRKKRGYGTKKSSFSTASIAFIDFGVNSGSTTNNYPPSTLSESNITKIDSSPEPEEENNHRDIEEGDKCESGLNTEEEERSDDEKYGDSCNISTKKFSQNSTSSDQFDFGGQDNNNDYLSDNEIDTEKKISYEIDTEKKVNVPSNPNSYMDGNDLDVYEESSKGNHSPKIDGDGKDSDVSEHESISEHESTNSNHAMPGQISSSTILPKDDTPTTGQSKTSQNKKKEFSCDLDDTETPMTRESVEINLTGGHQRRGDSDCSNDLDEFNFTLDDPELSSKKVVLPQKEKRQKRYGSTSKPLWMPHKSSNMDDVAAKNDDNNTSTKVGWDEEKERAILLHVPSKQKVLPVQDNVKEAGANEDELIDTKRETNNGNKKTKKRVYTTRFKKTGLSQDYRDCHDIDSPSPIRASSSNVSTSDTLSESTLNVPCASNSVKATDDKKTSRVQKKKSMDIDSELDAIANDSNACRVQPTSKSSLANARAFFRHLDSNHNLTIANETIGSSTQHCVQKRSTKLEKEYVDYCDSVQDTGVDPIGFNDFAQNWREIYRKK